MSNSLSSKTLQSLLTKEQIEILFGEALANPDEQQFPLDDAEIVEAVQRFLKDRDELKEEIEVLQESLKIVKDENEVNKKNLFARNSEIESKDETIAFGRKQLTGVIDRLSDASELLNNLGYTFDEDTETWEEKEKVECVEKTFYFSSDEGGYTFYEDTDSLIKNTPRIEDCYVFVGDTTKEKIEEDSENYREVDVIEYLADKKKEQKEKVEERRVQTGGEVDDRIKSLWIELYAQDKYGCEVSWKTIANLTKYDEEIAKKLYEEEYPEDPDSDEE